MREIGVSYNITFIIMASVKSGICCYPKLLCGNLKMEKYHCELGSKFGSINTNFLNNLPTSEL